MGCIEDLKPDVVLSGVSFREARAFVEEHTKEVYYVEPGYRLFEEYLIGIPPIAIGVDEGDLLFPYTKPCHGTFLLRLPGDGEIERLRREKKGK